MAYRYSRLTSIEEKKNTRRAIIFIVITLAVIAGLFFYGISLSANIATFFSGLKSGNVTTQVKDTTPPGPANIVNLPQATNQQNLQISGTCEPGATVMLSLNDNITSTTADNNGNFVFTVSLNKGDNKIFATVKDQAGNVSQPTDTYTVTFDNEVPKLDISSPQDGASFYGTKQQTVTLIGTTKPGSNATVNDRLIRLNDDGTFSYQYTLSTGDNVLNFSVTDQAGNQTTKSITLHYSD
ncbi:MAG: Ig-like domain-containing protein [Candidatus Microgenomates bacterium]|jgi:hypothetical protein